MRNCSQKVSIALILMSFASMAFAGGRGHQKNQTETRTEKIRAGVRFEFSRNLRPGRLIRARDGQDGSISRTYRINYQNGKPISKELIKETTKEPLPTVFFMGRGGFPSDLGSFTRKRVLDMSATAYDPSPGVTDGDLMDAPEREPERLTAWLQ